MALWLDDYDDEPGPPPLPTQERLWGDPALIAWVAEHIRPPWWHKAAACRGASDLFFMGRGGTSQHAKAICRECPVVAACLDFALEEPGLGGIWGGMSPKERMVAKRRRRNARVA